MAWEAGVRFDARRFEQELPVRVRALRSARGTEHVQRALDAALETLALYRGDFLSDEDVGDWHLDIRDRLSRIYRDAQLLVGDRSLELELHPQAVEAFRAAIRVDEFHEDAHRRLARRLQTDLDTEPDADSKALYNRLRKSEAV